MPALSFRGFFLLLAISLYAFFGAPTPDNPGLAEVMIGVFLVLAVSPARLPKILCSAVAPAAPLWRAASFLLFVYGLTIPVLIGLISGHSELLILRDVVPFLFMLLPFFILPLYAPKRFVTFFIAGIGIAFTARVLVPLGFEVSNQAGFPFFFGLADPAYLVNAPTVLFSALLMIGCAGRILYKGERSLRFAGAIAMLCLATVEIYAMAMIMQRATLGYLLLAVVILLGVAFVHAPRRATLLLFVLIGAIICFFPVLTNLMEALQTKTMLVGGNMRWQEWQVVFAETSRSPFVFLFGAGWGETISSPAVGEMDVNYTHSLFGAVWLKAGLIGVVLTALYLGALGGMLVRLLLKNPVVALALIGPFLIDVFLYASYKSLDFGLILFLIPLWAGASESRLAVAYGRPL